MEILSNLLHITQPVCEAYSEDSILGPLILRAWGVSYTYVSVCVCVCVYISHLRGYLTLDLRERV